MHKHIFSTIKKVYIKVLEPFSRWYGKQLFGAIKHLALGLVHLSIALGIIIFLVGIVNALSSTQMWSEYLGNVSQLPRVILEQLLQ